MRIAVFVENRPFFGAVLVHAPLLWELKKRHPDCRISLFSPFEQAEMLVQLGPADEIQLYRRDPLGTLRRLRAGRFDAVYNLRPATRWLDLVIGLCGAPERRGFSSAFSKLVYTSDVPHNTAIYRPRKYLTLLGDGAARADLGGFFRGVARTGNPNRGDRNLLVLPGGGQDFKLWGIERFFELCEGLVRTQPELKFVFVLGPAEAPLYERITAWGAAASIRVEIVAKAAVADLAALALDAATAVGNDCGPGHIVQMCGRPFVCVMSNQDGTGPQRIAEWVDAANQPLAVSSRPGEPITSISVRDVVRATEQALAQATAIVQQPAAQLRGRAGE